MPQRRATKTSDLDRLRRSYERLRGTRSRIAQELKTRERQIAELVAQQDATADILRAIRGSTASVRSVFDIIVENAARLCEAHFAFVMLHESGWLSCAAHTRCTPEFAAYLQGGLAVDRGTTSGRAALARKPVQIMDFLSEPEAIVTPAHRVERVRTVMALPMMRDDRLLGVISIWRHEAKRFTRQQIKLLQTFADQAVIAIENVRLFEAIRDKTRQLELANTYKSRFLAAASHDLRQPLHALNLFVGQLRSAANREERERLVGRIDAAVSSMNELFNALLDMSKLDAGVLTPELSEFPAARLLERIQTTFAEAAREKGLRLRIVPSDAWVRSDFILLERILLNLVSNAVRYTLRGGVVVGCRRRGRQFRFDVWDTGPGIPDDQRQNVFGEFYQLASDDGSHRGGLGLGLALVDRLSALLDHPVEMSSVVGKGSRFSVVVPLGAIRPARSDSARASISAADDAARNRLVVVIDDDALVLDGMSGMLRRWGCRVVAAPSETAALAQLKTLEEPPDLIISDYQLDSGKTGIEAIEHLRRALGTGIPAFLVSGDTAPERLREAAASNHLLLHKPLSPMTLRAVVDRFLKNRVAAAVSISAARA